MHLLQRALRRLQAVFHWCEAARAAERRRIAADLHDGPLQGVIGLEMRLAAARALLERDPAAAPKELEALAGLAASVSAELRAFQRTLSPPPVETTDLGALAQGLAETFAAGAGLGVRFQGPDAPVTASPETSLEVAQILREALANVRKHARAVQVEITLRRLAGDVEISIGDNGQGFPFDGAMALEELDRLGAGPASIRRRVGALGGALTVESRPGRGARLIVRIPV
jgi:signal transduction histidine kinase